MSGAAEFVARHLIFAGSRKPQVSLYDVTRHYLELVAGVAELWPVDYIRAGHANTDGSAGWHHYALRHKQILLRDHADGHPAVRTLDRSQVAFHEFTVQVEGLRVDAVGSVDQMLESRFDFVRESDC